MNIPLMGVLLLMNECSGAHGVRIFKRVINGVPLNGRPAYSVIRYYAALAHTWNPIWNYIGYWDYIKPTTVWCSGTLLTPGILQTACHCLAEFDRYNDRYLKPPWVRHSWEGQGVVYAGVSKKFGVEEESFEKYNYIKTLKFMVHSKCGSLGGKDAITYDYGIVQLDAHWIQHNNDPPTYPWDQITWSPMFPAKVLQEFHEQALRKQLVCLLVGFGLYIRDEDKLFNSHSQVLRSGWGTVLPRAECYRETGYALRNGNLSVHQWFSWDCVRGFPKHDQEGGPGDSGGPLSCDNVYFGVLSGVTKGVDKSKVFDIITKPHALTHTLYTNAIDFRRSFIRAIDDLPIYITRRLSDMEDDIHRNSHSSLNSSRTIPSSLL